ncbi:hypothetical protein JM951_11775 [Xanthomonas fragariae]|nr:hypothetical protein [Xanthomonas fragariae]MBL9221833.1 hypothetical protein [Xanthomonas fragariae]
MKVKLVQWRRDFHQHSELVGMGEQLPGEVMLIFQPVQATGGAQLWRDVVGLFAAGVSWYWGVGIGDWSAAGQILLSVDR